MALQSPHPSRESVTTINDDGSRFFLYPADVSGRFTIWRRIVALGLIAFYALLPWISINGYPAVFLDVKALKFHFFGLTFAPHDLWLAFFLISGLGFSLFYVTALFGRVWCGWACPQTVFLEQVYRRIERWIEGDSTQRRRLDSAPWTASKVIKRVTKQTLYVLVSLGITHLFLAYFISLPEVWRLMTTAPAANWGIFVFVLIASAILYFNFAWFREQLCIIICPYGRLQSALIDDNSIVIGYDESRGEPRGKVSNKEAGDCIDCNRCVSVCPTGIDIRQGLQLECIGCANCIDACDAIMKKVGRPKGLVRYDSLNGLAGLKTRILRPRVFLYTFLLLIGATVMLTSFGRLQPITATAYRMQGPPYVVDDTMVRNQFLVRLVNKKTEPVTLTVVPVADMAGLAWTGLSGPVVVAPNEEEVRPLIVTIPRAEYTGPFHLSVEVTDVSGDLRLVKKVEFLGPDPKVMNK